MASVICLAFVSCSDAKGERDQPLLTIAVESTQPFDAAPLNDLLSRQSAQGRSESSALLAALTSLAPDASALASVIHTARDPETGGYSATAIFDAVPDDDSVSGHRYDLTLRITGSGQLAVTDSRESWRCWEDRGHRTFSTEPCH